MISAENVMEVIYARRSVRSYVEDRPVEPEKIRALLDAGMAGPSACNLQPWEFIVVSEPELLRRVKATTKFGNYNAPLAIVICGNTRNTPWDDEDWKIDCAAAVENMMLLAVGLGLGSVWLGGFDEPELRALLDVPEDIGIMNLVYFGYPAHVAKPKSRYDESAVFYQKYDPARKRELRSIDMLGDASTVE